MTFYRLNASDVFGILETTNGQFQMGPSKIKVILTHVCPMNKTFNNKNNNIFSTIFRETQVLGPLMCHCRMENAIPAAPTIRGGGIKFKVGGCILLGRNSALPAHSAGMRPTATDVACSVVCVSVCLAHG